MKALKWVFPTGAALTVGGVFLNAQLERHSFENFLDLEFATLSAAFALLLGSLLAIVGSFLDRLRLTVREARMRGVVCWLVSAVSFLLVVTIGNVHDWTFTFVFPTFVGFIAGAVFLSKFGERKPTAAAPEQN